MTLRVLIVEDEYLIALMMREAVEEAGHIVVGMAADMKGAMKIAGKMRPDVATVDLWLARGSDGEQVARALFHEHGIRSLFASAVIDSTFVERCASLQPIGYVRKPFMESDIVRALASHPASPSAPLKSHLSV